MRKENDQVDEKVIDRKDESHPLQKPLMLIAVAIMFAGILIAGALLFTGAFSKTLQDFDARNADAPVQKPVDGSVALSLGDDPVLGDRTKAKIAIVEFSDYECPFCKQFHTDTFDKLVKKYVDTGKAVISFKDFPLSFHEPMASKEAAAANCVQKLAGDKAYFAYGASLYKNTATNGKGMSDKKIADLAVVAGVSKDDFSECVAQNDFKDEIAQDQADGEKAGVTGTPAFVIGTVSSDGTVMESVSLVGAQPMDAFEKAIDAQLKK